MIDEQTLHQMLIALCERSQEGIFIADHEFRYCWVNESFSMIVGYNEEFLLGRVVSIDDFNKLSEEDQFLARRIRKALRTDSYFHDDFSCMTHYGVRLDANITIWRIKIGRRNYYAGMLRDIRSATATKETLFKLMNYDQTTGLPNRHFFMSQFSDFLIDTYQELVLARFNVDRYRTLTNALSDSDANRLLHQIATRVNRLNLDRLKVFAHFGGDDFALLFEALYAEDVREDLDLIMQQFELPFIIMGEQIHIHISMGVSKYQQDGMQMDRLIRCAEKALSYAKINNGGDDVIWFDQDLGLDTLIGFKLESQLRTALEQNQFITYYQPQINLSTGQLDGFEALVRWEHPERGLLHPGHFMQTIIESRLSFELFQVMTEMIIQQMIRWRNMNLGSDFNVCVNTDAAEFRHPDFIPFIDEMLAKYDFDPAQLHIEMTESSLMVTDSDSVKIVQSLKDKGMKVALDDFGTGYASLSYLHHYPFDYVKIDKSFIDHMSEDKKHSNIVGAIINMSHHLGMKVIAEGIEDRKQASLLKYLGCEYGQGYFFSKPVASTKATALLLSRRPFDI